MLKNILGIVAIIAITCGLCFALRAHAAKDISSDALSVPHPNTNQQLVLAGGCFWGIQEVFQHTKGVVRAVSGYAGGAAQDAKYGRVSSGDTGHAGVVNITYDPKQISMDQLLDVYFQVAHNPTQLNYQGPDHGTQYRSAIFYQTPEQKKLAEAKINLLNVQKKFGAPIVTKLEPLNAFYKAEDYHQDYARLNPDNPYIAIHDAPKVVNLQKTFPELYRP
jgi:peptide-methionine (S)-S-oxide reductase